MSPTKAQEVKAEVVEEKKDTSIVPAYTLDLNVSLDQPFTADFTGLEVWLTEQLKAYNSDDLSTKIETRKDFTLRKSQRAALRKIIKAVEDERKSVKAKWLLPLNILENQIKEILEPAKSLELKMKASIETFDAEQKAIQAQKEAERINHIKGLLDKVYESHVVENYAHLTLAFTAITLDDLLEEDIYNKDVDALIREDTLRRKIDQCAYEMDSLRTVMREGGEILTDDLYKLTLEYYAHNNLDVVKAKAYALDLFERKEIEEKAQAVHDQTLEEQNADKQAQHAEAKRAHVSPQVTNAPNIEQTVSSTPVRQTVTPDPTVKQFTFVIEATNAQMNNLTAYMKLQNISGHIISIK